MAGTLSVLAREPLVVSGVDKRPRLSWAALLLNGILALLAVGFLLFGNTPARADGLSYLGTQKNGFNGVVPHSLALSPDGSHVYVLAAGVLLVELSVFSRDVQSGALTLVEVHRDGVNGVVGLGGSNSVTVSPDGSHVYTAGVSLSVFNRDVQSGALTFVAVQDNSGVVGLGGQSWVTVSPNGAHVYLAGITALVVYSRDVQSGALTFVEVQDNRGGTGGGGVAGPQGTSVTVSPDDSHVYVTNADNTLAVFSRELQSGALTFVEVFKDGVNGVDGLNIPRWVTVSPDGAHVYVTAFNDNSVAVFNRDVQSGTLTLVKVHKNDHVFFNADGTVREALVGMGSPGSVEISPDGTHAYVAGRTEAPTRSTTVVFHRDAQSGLLTFVDLEIDGVNGVDGAAVRGISPDGAHVYAAGRGVSVFTLSGRLTNPKPNITTLRPQGTSTSTARFGAMANANGVSTNVHFDYGTTTSFGSQTSPENIGSEVSNVFITHSVSGLTCGTTYHFRAVATNANGTTEGGNKRTFTPATPACSPSPGVTTHSALEVGMNGATLNATVFPNGSSTNVHFDYGTTTSFGSQTSPENIGSGVSNAFITHSVSGLTCGTTYHFRAVATNANVTTSGSDAIFTTSGCPVVNPKPSVTTNDASAIGANSATLNATANPNGSGTTVRFDYGTTVGYGRQTAPTNIGSGSSNVAVAHALASLHCGTTYHFRAVATNGNGTTAGADKAFTTSDCPVVPPTGTYTGNAAMTTTQCAPFEPNDAFTLTGSFSANTGPPGPFSAAGTLAINRFGFDFTAMVNLSGSVTAQGQVNGTFSESFAGTNGFTSSGTGTFTGSITAARLTLDLSGQDTDSGGITCNLDGVFNGIAPAAAILPILQLLLDE